MNPIVKQVVVYTTDKNRFEFNRGDFPGLDTIINENTFCVTYKEEEEGGAAIQAFPWVHVLRTIERI